MSAATALAMPMVAAVLVFVAAARLGPDQALARLLSIDAELQAAQKSNGLLQLRDLPESFVWLTGGFLLVAFTFVAIGFAAITVFLIWRYGTRMLLRAAHAKPVGIGEETALIRLVENLCIGAGLPMPRVYVVESPAPNAFATGRDPQTASLVVTRGLLTLLDRRELQGVIAHELSHIGNHDTRLSTTLAALVTTLCLPIRIVTAPFRFAFKQVWGVRLLAIAFLIPTCGMLISGYGYSFEMFFDDTTWQRGPRFSGGSSCIRCSRISTSSTWLR